MGFNPKTPGPRAPLLPHHSRMPLGTGKGRAKVPFSSSVSVSRPLAVSCHVIPSLCFSLRFLYFPLSAFVHPSASQFLSPRFKNLPKLTRECLFQKIPGSQGKVLLAQPGPRSCPWFHLRVQQGCWACTPPPWVREAMLGGGGLSKHPEGVHTFLPGTQPVGPLGRWGKKNNSDNINHSSSSQNVLHRYCFI